MDNSHPIYVYEEKYLNFKRYIVKHFGTRKWNFESQGLERQNVLCIGNYQGFFLAENVGMNAIMVKEGTRDTVEILVKEGTMKEKIWVPRQAQRFHGQTLLFYIKDIFNISE